MSQVENNGGEAYICNIDFEKNLGNELINHFVSSRENQEFEYFMFYLAPQLRVFSKKNYSQKYLNFVESLVQEKIRLCSNPSKITPWWGSFSNADTLDKLQNKVEFVKVLNELGLASTPTTIVFNEEQLNECSDKTLCKFPFGSSGRSNFLWPDHKAIILKNLKMSPCVAQLHLNRVYDFSTVFENNKKLGTITNIVDERFQYKGSIIHADAIPLQFQEEYSIKLEKLASYIKKQNYSGPYSIDSFIYEENGNQKLYFACEVNLRKTMGYVTIKMKERFYETDEKCSMFLSKKQLNEPSLTQLSPDDCYFYSYLFRGDCREFFNVSKINLPACSELEP